MWRSRTQVQGSHLLLQSGGGAPRVGARRPELDPRPLTSRLAWIAHALGGRSAHWHGPWGPNTERRAGRTVWHAPAGVPVTMWTSSELRAPPRPQPPSLAPALSRTHSTFISLPLCCLPPAAPESRAPLRDRYTCMAGRRAGSHVSPTL